MYWVQVPLDPSDTYIVPEPKIYKNKSELLAEDNRIVKPDHSKVVC